MGGSLIGVSFFMKQFIKHIYDDIGRIYIFDDGSKYYSVTTALGNTKDKRFLEEWRIRIGREKAEAITKHAGIVGTQVHECLENYLLKQPIDYPNTVIKNLCAQVKPYIDRRISRVYSTEKVLWSDEFDLAGTTDAVVDYKLNRVTTRASILDFKTANAQPKPEWITDYLIQLFIYSRMLAEMNDTTPINTGVLLFAYKKLRSKNNEVVVDLTKYETQAMKRIERFHEITR